MHILHPGFVLGRIIKLRLLPNCTDVMRRFVALYGLATVSQPREDYDALLLVGALSLLRPDRSGSLLLADRHC